MKRPILTLRISRRAIGAAVLTGDGLALTDGRHLTSRRERAARAAARYVERLLDLAKPGGVILDAPRPPIEGTNPVMAALTALLRDRQVDVLVIGKVDVLRAYGVRPLRSRVELRRIAHAFWPELTRIAGKVQPYVSDAAGAALYAETQLALHPLRT